MLSLFPAFIVLAVFGRYKAVHCAWIFLNVILLGPLINYYFAGIWVE